MIRIRAVQLILNRSAPDKRYASFTYRDGTT
jgi:hypothetical protein